MCHFIQFRTLLVLVTCICLLLGRVSCLMHFKGDPGELGDSTFDLSVYEENKLLSRKRRFVALASGTTLTISNKLAVPLFSKHDGNITGEFKGTVHVRYTAPDLIALGRRSIDSDRVDAYDSLVAMVDSYGMNGSGCLLRSVCEMAQEPLAGYGLLGELLRMFLSPNHNLSGGSREELYYFTEAERLGRTQGNCDKVYSTCSLSLEELVHSGITALNKPPSQRSMKRRKRRVKTEF